MTLNDVYLVSSIVSSFAVVASLVFVGLQMQQNARATRMAAAQSGLELLADNLGRVITTPDLAELLSNPDRADDFTDAEFLRVSNFLSTAFRQFEMLFIHKKYGLYEEDLWHGTEARLKQFVQAAEIQKWWIENRAFYAPAFAAYTDTVISSLPAPSNAPEGKLE